jgi:hypothetical protein
MSKSVLQPALQEMAVLSACVLGVQALWMHLLDQLIFGQAVVKGPLQVAVVSSLPVVMQKALDVEAALES